MTGSFGSALTKGRMPRKRCCHESPEDGPTSCARDSLTGEMLASAAAIATIMQAMIDMLGLNVLLRVGGHLLLHVSVAIGQGQIRDEAAAHRQYRRRDYRERIRIDLGRGTFLRGGTAVSRVDIPRLRGDFGRVFRDFRNCRLLRRRRHRLIWNIGGLIRSPARWTGCEIMLDVVAIRADTN